MFTPVWVTASTFMAVENIDVVEPVFEQRGGHIVRDHNGQPVIIGSIVVTKGGQQVQTEIAPAGILAEIRMAIAEANR